MKDVSEEMIKKELERIHEHLLKTSKKLVLTHEDWKVLHLNYWDLIG